jgi:hypothetical protein
LTILNLFSLRSVRLFLFVFQTIRIIVGVLVEGQSIERLSQLGTQLYAGPSPGLVVRRIAAVRGTRGKVVDGRIDARPRPGLLLRIGRVDALTLITHDNAHLRRTLGLIVARLVNARLN